MARRISPFVVIAIVAALAATGLAGPLAAPAGAARSPSKKYPAHWDSRILPLVQFVEKHRKLAFEHPIPVEFLTDARFQKRVRHDNVKVSASDRKAAEREVGELRALGLLQGSVDLIGAEKDLSGTDTLGYYDQDAKKMVIRGTDLKDTETRVTVVHELTHADQDQHFDLNKLDDATKSSGAEAALTALVEGDASRIEDQYLASLPQKEQDAYDKSLNAELDANKPGDAAGALANVPPILGLFDDAPYNFGEPFVDVLAARNGTKTIDGAFRHPPTTEQEIIDPVVYFSDLQPLRVAVPALDTGDRRQGSPDDFGALSLFMMLDSRIGFGGALHAVEAWGGDRYVSYRHDGHTCVRAAFRSRSKGGGSALATNLRAWAAAGPAGAATVTATPSTVTLTACDLGSGSAPSYDSLSAAVDTMTTRVELIGQVIGAGYPPATATCVSDHFVEDPSLGPLLQKSDLTKAETQQAKAGFQKFVSACGAS